MPPIVCARSLGRAFFNPATRKIGANFWWEPNHFLRVSDQAGGDHTLQRGAGKRFYPKRHAVRKIAPLENLVGAARISSGDLDHERPILYGGHGLRAKVQGVGTGRKCSDREESVRIALHLLDDLAPPAPQSDLNCGIARLIGGGISPRSQLCFSGFEQGTLFFAPCLLGSGRGGRAAPVPRGNIRIEFLKRLFNAGARWRTADWYGIGIGKTCDRREEEGGQEDWLHNSHPHSKTNESSMHLRCHRSLCGGRHEANLVIASTTQRSTAR